MLRRLSISQALCEAQRFLRDVSLPLLADYHQLAPHAVALSWFNHRSKIQACPFFILNRTLLIGPNFRYGRISSSTVGYSVRLSSSLFDQILRQFCTLEAFEPEKATDTGRNENVDKVYKTVLDYSNPEYKMEGALDKLGIELTTPLVVEVLHRLRFEEKLAFRFFNWAGHQEHYNHEPESYNKMIDILSSTKYKVKQFRIICDLLDYMKRSKKNSVPIEVLLNILRQYTEKHLTHLQKFAKKKKIRVKTQPEINAFNLMLDALCKCCLVEDAEAMFKRVKSKIRPNADTYNILFFGWCRVRNPTRGMSVLEDMIKMGHTPENFTYNTAIDTFCKAGMLTEAAELLEFMKTKGSTMSSPTAKTYAIMMVALVQNDRMDECFKILADMIDSGCLPDVSTYKELIEGMCSCGKIEAAYKFLEEMGRTGYPPDIVTYNCFLKVLCDNKDNDEALKLYQKMIDVGCMPSVQTYNILIVMFFRIGDSEGAFETWNEMDRRGCARDTDTYCVMIEGLFGCSNTKDAIYLLEQVINRGMKLPYKKFDTFLMQLSAVGDLQAIHRLSEHMRKFYNPAMARRFALNQKRKSMSLRGK
ncbi:Pentatricopeptide repeat-containing protein, mitochondrial [Sesamum alatum]|uniref:Pentatricopeptide repeat-containing protein, mitochondrial n=1 Tax=Sesamum alatum TaxID=300844 RepID=A0AAE2CTQ4_9LAMI|nr:Pentatricopeptide repeat-containing protein, mitochondrial [Sesamum alatum]